MHPELVYIASDRCGVTIPRLIYDAHCYNELPIDWKTVSKIHNRLHYRGVLPQFLEDYCLMLLAEHEKKSRLTKSYRNWIDENNM